MSARPDEFAKLTALVEGLGLRFRQRRDYPSFGDKLVEYADDRVAVRVVRERDFCTVTFADLRHRPDHFYDVAILRDLLVGSGEDRLGFDAKIAMFERLWPQLKGGLSTEAHIRLDALRKERVKRLFPSLVAAPDQPQQDRRGGDRESPT